MDKGYVTMSGKKIEYWGSKLKMKNKVTARINKYDYLVFRIVIVSGRE
jgi:hypothetical protein